MRCLVTLLLAMATTLSQADVLRIAAAANFTPVLPALTEQFTAQTGINVEASTGSTGSLYAQINNGAPFALLLSADRATADKIASSTPGQPTELFDFTCGQLVLWSASHNVADGTGWLAANPQQKIAIANPNTAPYGAAAAQVLDQLDWPGTRIQAENIAQAYQFGASGNVAAAFIAHSYYRAGKLSGGWLVPASLHTPLVHTVVATRNVSPLQQQQAQQFIAFLRSDAAQQALIEAGYRRCDAH